MPQIGDIAIGQSKVVKILQHRCRGAVCGILLGHIGSKCRVLLAADHFPSAGGIPLHARADIVDDKRVGILASMFSRICLSISLQNLQAGKKCCIVGDSRSFLVRSGISISRAICCIHANRQQRSQQHNDNEAYRQIPFHRSFSHVSFSLPFIF